MRAWYSQILIVMISNKYNKNKKTQKLLSSFLSFNFYYRKFGKLQIFIGSSWWKEIRRTIFQLNLVLFLFPVEHDVPGEHGGDTGDLLLVVHHKVPGNIWLKVESNLAANPEDKIYFVSCNTSWNTRRFEFFLAYVTPRVFKS